ncbi:hypothetical protein HR51_21765 [Burkholderia cepacia]|nr:hypothetical protein HR51_21765 [Burkholderia cepacia]
MSRRGHATDGNSMLVIYGCADDLELFACCSWIVSYRNERMGAVERFEHDGVQRSSRFATKIEQAISCGRPVREKLFLKISGRLATQYLSEHAFGPL